MRRPDAVHVVGVHVLVERPLDEVLRLVPGERPHLLVQEDSMVYGMVYGMVHGMVTIWYGTP